MPASSPTDLQPSTAFLERFRARVGESGILRFDAFVDLALYDAQVGYYRQNRTRVGYAPGTDFYTASTSGPLFGELVCAACTSLLTGRNLSAVTFVEMGAEPSGGILTGVAHPFKATRTLRMGDPISLEGECVVFSNELFDAQPFRRWVRRHQAWREIGVIVETENNLTSLKEVLLPHSETIEPLEGNIVLPDTAPEGYQLDLPLAATALLKTIVGHAWSGLFLAFDYGKNWPQLAHEQPAGTARAYFQHQQSNDLLSRPGHQDLTCHVVWDWLLNTLNMHEFFKTQVESQEAFFVHHAGNFIGQVMAEEATRVSQRKLGLLQLLHPAHLGQKFQVLHGLRGPLGTANGR